MARVIGRRPDIQAMVMYQQTPEQFCHGFHEYLFHVKHPWATNDFGFVMAMESILRLRLQHHPEPLRSILPLLLEFCAYTLESWNRFFSPGKGEDTRLGFVSLQKQFRASATENLRAFEFEHPSLPRIPTRL